MRIEIMIPQDCGELAELDKVCFSVPWSEQSFLEETENKLAVYLVAKEEKVVGYCGFWRVQDEVQITNIAVLPEFRGRGIAGKLINKMLEMSADMSRIILEVRESNVPAINLYKKFGFYEAGIRKKFYHSPVENGIVMVREI